MTTGLIHTPRQARSQNTQERVLQALEEMLQECFFEQVTIRDLAARSGVSSGTIYRRFKDKEALLPVLYARFDQTMSEWAAGIWDDFDLERSCTVSARVEQIVRAHLQFYRSHAPILRTVYLYMRLHGELSLENIDGKRQSLYQVMLTPLIQAFPGEGRGIPGEHKIKLFLLLLLSSINERMLFGELKPARMLEMDDERFARELTLALCRYLESGDE